MGAHYGAILVKTDQSALVHSVLEALARQYNRKFLVGPSIEGWASIFPSDYGQDDRLSADLAKQLPLDIFHLFVYHDDFFVYYFYREGELLDKYSSDPDYFEEQSTQEKESLRGKPEVFGDLLPRANNLIKIKSLLSSDDQNFVFAQERMKQFINLMGLPNVLSSYEYLQQGERYGIKSWKQFVHVPDLTREKQAKKAASTALRTEKRRLKKEGLFVCECIPDATARKRVVVNMQFCFDPVQRGLLVCWNNNDYEGKRTQLTIIRPPWSGKPVPMGSDFSFPNLDSFRISRNGKWLALSDLKLHVWDWPARKLVNGFQFDIHNLSPIGFSADEKYLFCGSPKGFIRISLETKEAEPAIDGTIQGFKFNAINPSISHMVTVFGGQSDQLAILDLDERKVVSQLFFGGRNSPFSGAFSTYSKEITKAGIPNSWVEEWSTIQMDTGSIFSAKFSPDGGLLFCATSEGLRVFAWEKLLAASETTPNPKFSLTPAPAALDSELHNESHANYFYDVAFDEQHNRLLGCGIDGRIHYLGLGDGDSGVLLEPIEECSVARIQLSMDREFLCLMCVPTFGGSGRKYHWLQIWNYPALCRKAGIE